MSESSQPSSPASSKTSLLTCFPPVMDKNTEILILGSFPGIASLTAQQYYAHPRNQFWRLMSALIAEDLVALPYPDRLKKLQAHHIGLWDVIAACARTGSLDSAIRDAQHNDFQQLKRLCPKLKRIGFNGKTSGKQEPLFAAAGFATFLLPSSSPAYALMTFEQKLAVWRGIMLQVKNSQCTYMLIKRKSIEADANLKSGPGKKSQPAEKPKAARKVKFAPVTLSEQFGIRYLHFGTEWVQGAMRISKPDWIELEYAQQMMAWMLFNEQPQHIVQLGLGTGALTKFCYRRFPEARITAIDLNPSVITICETMFKLPANDERLNVIEMDALDYVNDPAHHGSIDALQVDVYDATARGPVLDTPEFYQACAACLTPDGIMTVNLFGDHPSYAKNLSAMHFAFDTVISLPEVHEGNVIAIAFNTRPVLDIAALYERAAQITAATKLPAKSWVNGIKAWQAQQ